MENTPEYTARPTTWATTDDGKGNVTTTNEYASPHSAEITQDAKGAVRVSSAKGYGNTPAEAGKNAADTFAAAELELTVYLAMRESSLKRVTESAQRQAAAAQGMGTL